MKKYSAAIIVFLCLLIIPYYYFDRESISLDTSTRELLSGQFIELPDGVVHYELTGPQNGNVVVLVHGFSAPSFVWDPIYNSIVNAGFRVLRFDLYGRGFSDRPDTQYDMRLFTNQLSALLSALKIEGKIDIIALSMGGAIAVDFAVQYPQKIRKMALLAPAGFPVNMPLIGKIIRLPLLGDYLSKVLGDRTLISGLSKSFYLQDKVLEFQEKFKPQMKYKGFKRAILSTLRNMPLSNMKTTYEQLGKKKIRTLLIWGRNDKVIPFENHTLVKAAIPHAEFYDFDKVGHLPSYEQPEKVIPLLIQFLSSAQP